MTRVTRTKNSIIATIAYYVRRTPLTCSRSRCICDRRWRRSPCDHHETTSGSSPRTRVL